MGNIRNIIFLLNWAGKYINFGKY